MLAYVCHSARGADKRPCVNWRGNCGGGDAEARSGKLLKGNRSESF